MSFRRMLPFILINIIVSTVVVLAILTWWESRGDVADVPAAAGVAETAVADTVPLTTSAADAVTPNSVTPQTEEEGPPIHTVQAGDTLGSISQFYEVSMDDIMEANGLDNPNLISVGQQLIIPVGGLPTAEPASTATAETAVLPTPIATEPPTDGTPDVEITQVIGAGSLAEEAVQIRNVGSASVALLDWKLVDRDGRFYTFGRVTLFGDGAGILVHSESGSNSATELFWGEDEAVWESGELVTLLDADENIVATYTVP